MKSKLFLLLIGIVIVIVVVGANIVSTKKQTTSTKAAPALETPVTNFVILKDDKGNELKCVMKDGVCNVYTSGTGVTVEKRGMKAR